MGLLMELPLSTFPPPMHSSIKRFSHHNKNYTKLDRFRHSPATTLPATYTPKSNQMLTTHLRLVPLVTLFLHLIAASIATPVFVDNPSLAQFQSGRNIRHLPCIVRKSGLSGICMFAIDCIKQNGTHLGTCIDRFYFGSCCQMKDELYAPELSDNSIDQNTISHFSHEPTTLPTSALFKLTTEAPSQLHTTSNASEMPKNVTQSYMQNKVNTSPTADNTKPSKYNITKRPITHTTHKHSQFVIRTTSRPYGSTVRNNSTTTSTTMTTTILRPTTDATTVKPSRQKTTTPTPILTIHQQDKNEYHIELTTTPSKFFTFQIVETTTATPSTTNTSNIDAFINTFRPQINKKPEDIMINITTTTTEQSTTPEKPKPYITRRPISTTQQYRKPSKRPTARPSIEAAKPFLSSSSTNNATSILPPRRPPIITTIRDELPQTTLDDFKATSRPKTTHAPRPRPKPNVEIVKLPNPVAVTGEIMTTERPAPVSTNITTTNKRPSTTSKTPPASTSTTKATTQKPTASSTTKTTTTTRHPSKTTVSKTTTTIATTHNPITLTTVPPKISQALPTATTMKPGLVTWTNEDAEPTTFPVSEMDWQPRPAPADWVPVPTIAPEQLNKTELDSVSTEMANVPSSSEKIIVSVSSSVSQVISTKNNTITPKPLVTPPTTSIPIVMTTKVSTTEQSSTIKTITTIPTASINISTTSRPNPTKLGSTTSSMTSTSTTTEKPTTTTTTTEAPFEFETSTPVEGMSTDSVLSTSSMEVFTEDVNTTMESSTTQAPANSLEGVDYRQICGRRMFPEPRIVGGSNAAFGRWPWQISLRQWRTSTYLHKCGAALLNENWAITAAHCVDNVPPSDLLLRLGEYDLAEEEEPYGYQERRVQIVASHPQFDPRTFEYDLALLRFYEPVTFQPNIIPVCVPNSDENFIGQTAFVTGWGRLYEDGPLPSVLQEVAVPVINNTICESMYRAAGYIEHIPHIFICAGWKKGGYDSCEGDSGGPMVLQRESDKRFQLGGVISWGIGCAEANQPGVYTRISEFRDWINQILQF